MPTEGFLPGGQTAAQLGVANFGARLHLAEVLYDIGLLPRTTSQGTLGGITTKGKGETPAEGSVGRQQSVSKAQWAQARTELPVAEPAEVAAETIKQHQGKKNPATTIADTTRPA